VKSGTNSILKTKLRETFYSLLLKGRLVPLRRKYFIRVENEKYELFVTLLDRVELNGEIEVEEMDVNSLTEIAEETTFREAQYRVIKENWDGYFWYPLFRPLGTFVFYRKVRERRL